MSAYTPPKTDLTAALDKALGDPVSQWAVPEPLTAKIQAIPYPVDALPEVIRLAIDEVHAFVKAPYPLVAGCALSALSVAIQSHVDIERAKRLQGACSIFSLSIADSGERKSTCDGFFSKASLCLKTMRRK